MPDEEDNPALVPLLHQPHIDPALSKPQRRRVRVQQILESKHKHYAVMGLVAIDVTCSLADVVITLIACDRGLLGEPWYRDTGEGLWIAGEVFNALFLLELLVTVWAFGFEYFTSWFHCFDALIILVGCIVDIATHGIVEEIASLVIILRLWRFVKIIEELSVGASEQMDELTATAHRLEKENSALRSQVEDLRSQELARSR